ncbi:hypothetical protein HanIR_Chr16g0801251 [Helianthus annuus]|nr:hypothetical protein HanIR_Chr16g0801251 [Helianthus annuus]
MSTLNNDKTEAEKQITSCNLFQILSKLNSIIYRCMSRLLLQTPFIWLRVMQSEPYDIYT